MIFLRWPSPAGPRLLTLWKGIALAVGCSVIVAEVPHIYLLGILAGSYAFAKILNQRERKVCS